MVRLCYAISVHGMVVYVYTTQIMHIQWMQYKSAGCKNMMHMVSKDMHAHANINY